MKELAALMETLAVGAVGGLMTYWLARRQSVSERAWERRYEIYCGLFDHLNAIEHCMRVLEQAVDTRPSGDRETGEVQDAITQYRAAVLAINQVQERLLLLGATDAQLRVTGLYAFFGTVDPAGLLRSGAPDDDIRTALRDVRREAAGRNGELALLARGDLAIENDAWSIARWARGLYAKATQWTRRLTMK